MNEAQRISYLKKINPYVFEELILSRYELLGYKIERNTKYSGDGGYDGKVWINGELHLIQAKRYRGHIKKEHIYEFIRLIQKNNCNGIFIHTGKTPNDVFVLLRSYPELILISGSNLAKLMVINQPV